MWKMRLYQSGYILMHETCFIYIETGSKSCLYGTYSKPNNMQQYRHTHAKHGFDNLFSLRCWHTCSIKFRSGE